MVLVEACKAYYAYFRIRMIYGNLTVSISNTNFPFLLEAFRAEHNLNGLKKSASK